MTKSELIKRLSQRNSNLFYKDVEHVVDIVFDTITSALAQDQRIELRGFGAFSSRKRNPRTARNPKTNATVQLSDRVTPYFRAGKELKERLNQA